MHVKNIRVKRNFSKSIESVIFLKLSRDPSPRQVRRFKRQERFSRFCALVLAVVMLVGIGIQIGKFTDIALARKNIKALKADNRLLEVSIENLKMELMMKTQDNIVCYLASRDLGMIRLDEKQLMVLPIGETYFGDTQLVSTGYPK